MSDAALTRLRHADDPALDGLVRLLADHVLDTPVAELIDPSRWAGILVRQGRRLSDDEAAAERLRDAWHGVLARAAAEQRPPRELLPADAVPAVRALVGQPVSPSEALVLRLIRHDAVRSLLRDVLQQSLHAFGQRARALDTGVLGGVGQKAAQRGRSLFGGLAQGLSEAAGGLVGAVRDEVEAAFEARVHDFVGGAADEAVRAIAAWLSDPAHAASLAALRVSAVDVLLDTPVHDLGAEVQRLVPDSTLDAWRSVLTTLAQAPDAETRLTDALRQALGLLGDHPLGMLLDEIGVREAWRDELVSGLTPDLRRIVASDAFGAWWTALHTADVTP